jgi:hypothetical protein
MIPRCTYIGGFLVPLQAGLIVVLLHKDSASRSEGRFVLGSLRPSRLRAELEAGVKGNNPLVHPSEGLSQGDSKRKTPLLSLLITFGRILPIFRQVPLWIRTRRAFHVQFARLNVLDAFRVIYLACPSQLLQMAPYSHGEGHLVVLILTEY